MREPRLLSALMSFGRNKMRFWCAGCSEKVEEKSGLCWWKEEEKSVAILSL